MHTLLRLPLILLETALRQGASAVKDLLRLVAGGGEPPAARPARADAFAAAEARARPSRTPRTPPTPAPAAPPEPEAELLGDEPIHVSRGAARVASFGPVDEPGASLGIQPPWRGYEVQPAAEIVARVRGADEATRAVVLLYEREHKKRRTVLEAAGG